ncbi:hypothetical protein [Brevibacillus sp. SYSU BS000544]|uniref:hypothetical protein n=1 Tax=Brevibacillus sp. SYSU BS000544 TaxID=3416443 RepID=UPI003CE504FC
MYNTQNQLTSANFYASHPVFQPGFAGTNPQAVRQDIAREGGFAPVNVGQFSQPSQIGTPFSNVQAVFQPGFAGTNPQEVRQDIAAPLNVGQFSQPSQVGAPFGNVQAVFQPGFAGTNSQEVRQDIAREIGYVPTYPVAFQNANVGVGQIPVQVPGALGGGVQAIFQPGFAGTNAQEVRQDYARSANQYQAIPFQQQQQLNQQVYNAGMTTVPTYQTATIPQFASGVQAIFQPGFAGTNVQEVRALNSGYPSPQQAIGIGYSTIPAYQASTVNQFGVLPTGVFGR